MRANLAALAMLAAGAAIGQTGGAPAAAANSTVSGVVKDAGTGQPLEGYTVSTSVNVTWVGNTVVQSSTTKDVKSTTDAQGRYSLSDLPPGKYRIAANNAQSFGSRMTRRLTLAGQDMSNVDFNVVADGTISGKVLDENKEPVTGLTVYLVSQEYHLGTVGYFIKDTGRTNDRGEYSLRRVNAGRPYLITADKRDRKLPARSETPLNPKLRRPVPMRTWYPNSPAKEGAQAVMVRPGEHREGVDLEVKKSPSYCIDGTLAGSNGAGSLMFQVEAMSPSSGTSSSGGVFMGAAYGTTSADGKFRVCDLYPATYRVTASELGKDANYGVAAVTVADKDLHDLHIATVPGMPLAGEVVWDGAAPEAPVKQRVNVSLTPLFRTQLQGENSYARVEIPGTFDFSGLVMDDFSVRAFLNIPHLYVKDVTYSGNSVKYGPLRLGSAMGNTGLRVVLAHDGATLNVRVADKNSKPMADINVVALPADIASEGMLASAMVTGQTDQRGDYTTVTLAPGRYYVFASEDAYDATVESIGKLWRLRNRFTEVELPPNGSAQVTLGAVKLE